jgi:hypothetical protein
MNDMYTLTAESNAHSFLSVLANFLMADDGKSFEGKNYECFISQDTMSRLLLPARQIASSTKNPFKKVISL